MQGVVKTPRDKFIESNADDKRMETELYRSVVGFIGICHDGNHA